MLIGIQQLDNFGCPNFQEVKYDYTVNLASTGDWSEYMYDIESYWKLVGLVVFQEWYWHRGSLEPASVNIIDLTCCFDYDGDYNYDNIYSYYYYNYNNSY